MRKSLNRRRFLKTSVAASSAFAVYSIPGCRSLETVRPEAPAAGRLMMIDLPAPRLDSATREFILRNQIRAAVLFGKNIESREQTRALVLELAELMGTGALIAIDQEGGGVLRTEDLPFAPSAMSLGATGDPDLARAVGAATARGLRSMGINWNFAPVLDVNSNPLNPIIGDRSFGEDPQLVAELGLAWAEGSMTEGVATCVKHFPGHGDTHLDSHLALPTVTRDRERLEAEDLYPFRQAAEAGIPAFMTSHIVFPAFDAERPATLSRTILTGLLREEWGYDGVIVTDAMDMRAIADNYGRDEAAVMAVQAGADMITALGSLAEQEETRAALQLALDDQRIRPEQFSDTLRRLDRLAARFPVRVRPYSLEEETRDGAIMVEAWQRGLSTHDGPRPVPEGTGIVLVVADGVRGEQVTGRGLSGPEISEMMSEYYDVAPVFYGLDAPRESLPALRATPRDGRTVIFASTSRRRPDDELKVLIAETNPDLHLALWNPYSVLDVDAPALISYGFRPEALHAVIAWMRGRATAEGRLPIRLA